MTEVLQTKGHVFLCEILDPFVKLRLVPNSISILFCFLYFISTELKKSKEIASKGANLS